MIPAFFALTIILLTGAAVALILAISVWRMRRPGRGIGVAERLRAQLSESPIPIRGGGDVRVTVSIGVAGADRVGDETIDDLLRDADQAMYRAKAAGRNCIFAAAPKP